MGRSQITRRPSRPGHFTVKKLQRDKWLSLSALIGSDTLIENAFLLFKRWRGIATGYAKNTASSLGAIQICCIALLGQHLMMVASRSAERSPFSWLLRWMVPESPPCCVFVSFKARAGWGKWCLCPSYKICRYPRVLVIADRLFHRTPVSLPKGFSVTYWMAADKGGISALHLGKRLTVNWLTAYRGSPLLRHTGTDRMGYQG